MISPLDAHSKFTVNLVYRVQASVLTPLDKQCHIRYLIFAGIYNPNTHVQTAFSPGKRRYAMNRTEV